MDRAQAQNYRVDYPERPNQTWSAKEAKRRWRFKPRSIWPFLSWGFVLFLGCKIVVWPLCEGMYTYLANNREIYQLKAQYATMQKQLEAMKKKRDYMKTPSYIEERAHEIGLVKPEEAQMVVMEGAPAGMKLGKKINKKVEIGD